MAITLAAAHVEFHTRLLPKNANSVVEVIITDDTGAIVAKESNSYGAFAVNSDSGPNPLTVYNQAEKSTVHPGGQATVNWLPVPAGATWECDITVDLVFSDGSHIVVDENNKTFDAVNNQTVIGL